MAETQCGSGRCTPSARPQKGTREDVGERVFWKKLAQWSLWVIGLEPRDHALQQH
jgi:hypothetical protein